MELGRILDTMDVYFIQWVKYTEGAWRRRKQTKAQEFTFFVLYTFSRLRYLDHRVDGLLYPCLPLIASLHPNVHGGITNSLAKCNKLKMQWHSCSADFLIQESYLSRQHYVIYFTFFANPFKYEKIGVYFFTNLARRRMERVQGSV